MLIRQQSSGQSHCQGRLKLVMSHDTCLMWNNRDFGNIFARQDPLLVHSVPLLWGATLKLSGEYSHGAFKYVLSNNRWNLERDQSPLLIKIILIRLIKVFLVHCVTSLAAVILYQLDVLKFSSSKSPVLRNKNLYNLCLPTEDMSLIVSVSSVSSFGVGQMICNSVSNVKRFSLTFKTTSRANRV